MSREPERSEHLLFRVAAVVVVAAFGLFLLWPVPIGRMPLSGDHTVHLARAWMTAQHLAEGRFAGWSSNWFIGFPLAELYPPGGDLLVIAVHTLGLGLVSWPVAYALAFSFAFVLQGLVLVRLSRKLGFGLATGVVAAILCFVDPGFTREGGWMYTVWFGVWPQALATSLVWLGFHELVPTRDGEARKRPVVAGIVFGLAALTHPMSLPTIVLGMPIFVLAVGVRADEGVRTGILRRSSETALALLVGLGIAAFWLIPMMANRGFMSSYGWLHASLEQMATWASEGRLSQRMPAAVGFSALAGLGVALLGGNGFLRFTAVYAVALWTLAASDAFWLLRLDRLSEGFTHLQYQRFLTAAKPGIFLLAAVPAGLCITFFTSLMRGDVPRIAGALRPALAAVLLVAAAVHVAWLGSSHGARQEDDLFGFHPGEIETRRKPELADPEAFEADYRDFLAWAEEEWATRSEDYRIAFVDQRNTHWFMDSIVFTQMPIFKAGFTPGDNFVHKPEAAKESVLDAARVRYVVRRAKGLDRKSEVIRFGPLRVTERPHLRPLAVVQGEGATVQSIAGEPHEGEVRVLLDEVVADDQLVFAIAGHARWEARVDGVPRAWVELPIWGPAEALDPAERNAGHIRGGKADGDDGSEPTLLTVPLSPGDEEVVLRYRQWRWFDQLAVLATLLSLLFVLASFVRRSPFGRRFGALLEGFLLSPKPGVVVLALAAFLLVGAVARWTANARAARASVVERLADAEVDHVSARPFKSGMLVRPAAVAHRKRESSVVLRIDDPAPTWSGFFGFDDDEAKTRQTGAISFTIEARPVGDEEWQLLHRADARARPTYEAFEIDASALEGRPIDLRITTTPRGGELPRFGFDLDFGGERSFR